MNESPIPRDFPSVFPLSMRGLLFIFFVLVLSILFSSSSIYALAHPPAYCVADTSDDEEKDRNGTFLVLPIISFSPETSLNLGALGVYFFRFKGAPAGTQLSTVKFPITYTLNNQAKVRLSYEFYTNSNNHIFDGAFQYIRFPLLFWGVGPETSENAEQTYTTQQFSFENDYLYRVNPHNFLGFKILAVNSTITEISDDNPESTEDDRLLQIPGSVNGGQGGFTSGFGPIYRFDKRDNVFNATTGPYVQATLSTFRSFLGSDFNYTRFKVDARHFIKVWQGRHILALNAVGDRIWGSPSFENMALLGGDQIMRGHYEGRYRDRVMIAAQAEYRLPLGRKYFVDTSKGLSFWERWGMVAFAGLGNVAPELSDYSLSSIKSSLGVGIRYLALPKERANIRIDVGFGSQNPAFYFNIRESF